MEKLLALLLATALWSAVVSSYALTDTLQDADPAQSGYLPNHNMDPNVVGSSSFGILWSQTMSNSQESWFAKPLVFTMDGTEMVITASNMNNVRIHSAKNGTLMVSRQLTPPFLRSDIGCADIPNFIGVTGTPIIDTATNIIYMFAKGYKGGAASGGLANGMYQMYTLQLPTLQDVPGFPITMEGNRADNDPARYFIGGTLLQRPALASQNGVILVAFGGHCDLFNYTGYVAAISKTPGVGVVSLFAMESSPGAPTPQPLDLLVEEGGKAGIWQSGMGLAVDGSRFFAVTGNGQGHANGNIPASGRLPLSTLDECVINFSLSSAGKIGLTDYFEPYDYVNMDAGDRDLGSSGVCLLDSSTFKTATVSRIAVTVGKNSKVYVMNAENLGGFKQGSGGTDGVIQTITASNAVFGGAGSYPLEGGYFYFTPVGDATFAYKFGTDESGAPFFTLAGKTPSFSAGRVGVGQPTITTNKGQAGTGILWITDVNTGLRAFQAVPDANGVLQPINLPATPGINKFQRPVFGDGRVFVTASNKIICLGAPVNLPLICSDPVDFGIVQTGSSGTATVSCTARIAISKVKGCTTASPRFKCDNSTLPTGALTAGATFSFSVSWNITKDALAAVENTSYGTIIPGPEGSVLTLFTTNIPTGYSTSVPISLSGTVVSKDPFLFVSPGQVDFGGLILGAQDAVNGLTASASIQNIGNGTMTLLGMAWRIGNESTSPHNNVTFSGSKATFGLGFSAASFPAPGRVLAAGETIGVPLFFNASTAGSYSISVTIWSDGGIDEVLLSASAGSPAIASIAVSKEGGWDNSVPVTLDFGEVLAGTAFTKQLRICNVGGSVLTITKSKPLISPQLTATNPYGEFLEGQKIAIGSCAYATVAVYAGTVQPNHAAQHIGLVWVLNTDGQDALNPNQEFGVREINTSVTITTRQVGPKMANGVARYQWTGCFKDTPARNLQAQVNTGAQQTTNTNDQCQNLCFAAGYTFAGTQYHQECWCGNTIKFPATYNNDSLNYCTFSCSGDTTESCGGDGGYMSLYADTTKFDIQAFWNSVSGGTTSSSTSSLSTTSVVSTSVTSSGAAITTSGGFTSSSTISIPATSSTASAPISGQWSYLGCYTDNVGGVRSLSSKTTAADTMTLESCAGFCSAYNFFGAEYGRECFCGYTLDTATLKATESDCDIRCAGNSTQICGKGDRLSVYKNAVYYPPPAPLSHVPRAGNYSWSGCYSEATAGRALSLAALANDDMTTGVCATFCNGKGAQFMGVEYGRECYCGDSLGVGSTLQASTSCNIVCRGNSSEYCGAGGRLDFYTFSPVAIVSSISTSSLSSSTSSVSSFVIATSSGSSSAAPSSLTTTLSSSTSRSLTSSSTLSSSPSSTSSTSSSLTTSNLPSSPSSSSAVSSTSPTSVIPSVPASMTSSSSSSASSLSNVVSSAATGPTPTPTNGYYHLGCFSDTSSGHALPLLVANNSMTPELCIAVANSRYSAAPTPTAAARLPYVFIEYHHECYGGTSFDFKGSAVTTLVGTKACTNYCYGSVITLTSNGAVRTTTNLANKCGGGKQFNLYALSTTVAFPTTGGPLTTKTPT